MSLSLQVIDKGASLNAFSFLSSISVAAGEDAELTLMLWQPTKKIRYIPASGATITIDLLQSDGTVLNKTASNPFADDRSIIRFTLSDSETATLITQSLNVKIVESSTTTYAVLKGGFQKVPIGGC